MIGAMASEITSLTIVYATVYSGADQRKHQSSASLAFLRGIYLWLVNSPHKGPVTENVSIWWLHHEPSPPVCTTTLVYSSEINKTVPGPKKALMYINGKLPSSMLISFNTWTIGCDLFKQWLTMYQPLEAEMSSSYSPKTCSVADCKTTK